jgi:hypothetical protein
VPVLDIVCSEIDRQTDKRLAAASREVDLVPSEYRTSLPPNWRWQYAAVLRDSGRRPHPTDDDWIRLATRFLEAKQVCPATRSGVEYLRRRFPGLHEAWRIYSVVKNDRLDQRWALEAYLCSGADLDAIAERIREHRDTVTMYAHLFFDVLGKQHLRTYMLNDVIGRSIHYGLTDREYDLLWKLLGFLKGPMFLDCFLLHDGEPMTMTSYAQMSAVRRGLYKDAIEDRAVVAARTGQIDYNREAIFVAYNDLCKLEQAAGPGESQSLIHNNIRQMISSFGFAVADDPGAPAEYTKNGVEYRASYLIERAIGHDVEAPADLAFPPERAGPTTLVEP